MKDRPARPDRNGATTADCPVAASADARIDEVLDSARG